MKLYMSIFTIVLSFIVTGCDETETQSSKSGFHFQGRDCLACHNIDLGIDKKLVVGGSMFKDKNITDFDNLENSCNADMAIVFLNSNYSVEESGANFFDGNSHGNNGQGNIFLLDRLFNSSLNGSYRIRIIERTSGVSLAQSTELHDFSGNEYEIDNPDDNSNRLSCNGCHGVSTLPLYVQYNKNICK